uniref:Uncharacterized protein n=1 Tax=Leersia perrieri TaxID=77586 RepID=A0A0D9VXK1_9ORYZ
MAADRMVVRGLGSALRQITVVPSAPGFVREVVMERLIVSDANAMLELFKVAGEAWIVFNKKRVKRLTRTSNLLNML